MLQFQVIGNLGADARVVDQDGRRFVSFNVGHNDRWTDAAGVAHESTTWVSCTLNGDGGKLLPFLTKGRTVFVEGRGSARVFSSERARAMVAGLNCMVDRIELVGTQPDRIPAQLFTEDGVAVRVIKHFFVESDAHFLKGMKKTDTVALISVDGRRYTCNSVGYITPAPDAQPQP